MGEIIEFEKKENKVVKFVKQHKGKIIAGVGILVGGALLVVTGKKLCSGSKGYWVDLGVISETGVVRNSAKWNSADEWNGVVTGSLHGMTLSDMCEVGKEIISAGGLDENTVVEELVFITSKNVE